MNEKEIRETIKQIKKQMMAKYKGKSEEEIEHMLLDSFFKAFCEDNLSKDDLIAITCVMGYEPNYKILNEIEKEKKKGGK